MRYTEPGASKYGAQLGRASDNLSAIINAALKARDAIKVASLAERLSAAAGRHEISLDAYESDDAPNGFYVSFYL